MRRSAEPPEGPGVIDENTAAEVLDQHISIQKLFELDPHLSQTFFAVPAPVVAFKLELSGRPRKLLNTVCVQLGGGLHCYQAELRVS